MQLPFLRWLASPALLAGELTVLAIWLGYASLAPLRFLSWGWSPYLNPPLLAIWALLAASGLACAVRFWRGRRGPGVWALAVGLACLAGGAIAQRAPWRHGQAISYREYADAPLDGQLVSSWSALDDYETRDGGFHDLPFTVRVLRTWPDGREDAGQATGPITRVRVRQADGTTTEARIAANQPLRVGNVQFVHDRWIGSDGRVDAVVLRVTHRGAMPVIWIGMVTSLAGLAWLLFVPAGPSRREPTP